MTSSKSCLHNVDSALDEKVPDKGLLEYIQRGIFCQLNYRCQKETQRLQIRIYCKIFGVWYSCLMLLQKQIKPQIHHRHISYCLSKRGVGGGWRGGLNVHSIITRKKVV